MTHRRTHQFVAFVCSVATTLTLFSAVISLSAPAQGGHWLARSTAPVAAQA